MLNKALAFVFLAFALSLPAHALKAQAPEDRAALTATLRNLEIEEPNRYQIIKELLDIDPQVGFEVLRDIWKDLRSIDAKIAILNTYLAAANPHIVEIAYIGATDPNLVVQNFALNVAESVSFRSFTDDYDAFLAWYKTAQSKPLKEILTEGVTALTKRYQQADDSARELLLNQLLNRNYSAPTRIAKARREVVLSSPLLDVIGKSLNSDATPNALQMGFQLFRLMRPDEAFLKRYILPLCKHDQPASVRLQAVAVLARPDCKFATATVLQLYLDEYPESLVYNVGQTLSQIGDASVIPTLIGILDADNTREGALVVGNVLAQLTGVFINESHDAIWWREWWRKNRTRLPEEIRNLPIPKITVRKRQAQADFNASFIRSETRQADGTPQSSYWLLLPSAAGQRQIGGGFGRQPAIQDNPPRRPRGLGLLIVLSPGDGNGAIQANQWQEIAQAALKGRYIVALPVAPRWNNEQKVAWLTAANKGQVKEARFTTEAFVNSIVTDVSTAYSVDNAKIFVMGANDSGIAAYSSILDEKSRVKGAYLYNGTFKAAQLPSLKTAKGKKFFLFHEKENKQTPYLSASTAQLLLTQNGATVKLEELKAAIAAEVPDKVAAALEWLESGK